MLPDKLHYRGESNDWVRATRPGQRLHSFLEGACFDAFGALWLADVPYGRIFRIDHGVWELAFSYDGEPHGIASGGSELVIADHGRGLLKAGGSIDTLCDRWNTERFRGLSDLAIAPNGDIWFTDPGRSSLSDPTGRLFRLRDGRATPILTNVAYPNGVALSPDGQYVYLAVTRANAVWRLLADAPEPTPPMTGVFLRLSGGLGPDGLAVDARGRIAVAQAQAARVNLFDAMGDWIATIHVTGGNWTTSCAFGPDDALYIVEAEAGAVHRCDLSEVT